MAESATYPEQEAKIFGRQAAHRRVIGRQLRAKGIFNNAIRGNDQQEQEAYRCINHCTFLLLQLDDPTFDAIFDNEFDGLDRAVLAQTMDSVHSLVLDSRVPNPLN